MSPNLITIAGKNDALNDNQQVYTYLTKGAIGCALSHKKTYEKIINDNIDVALILEDDITFDDKFNERMVVLEKKIPKNYDILFLGYSQASIDHFDENYDLTDFTKPGKIYGLFGYIVTNQGAKKLLNVFPITFQLDSEISNHFDKINVYAVAPKNRIILSDPSSIDTKFGTDIQIRPNQPSVKKCSDNIKLMTLFLIILVVTLIAALVIVYFKYNTGRIKNDLKNL